MSNVVDFSSFVRKLTPPQWGATITISPADAHGHAEAEITAIYDPHLAHEVAERCAIYAEALQALADKLRETASAINNDAALKPEPVND